MKRGRLSGRGEERMKDTFSSFVRSPEHEVG